MQLSDQDRLDLFNEVRVLEVEFGHWCKLFATRTRERQDVFEGLQAVAADTQKLEAQQKELRKELAAHRVLLPTCMGVAAGLPAAVQAALDLNTTLDAEGAPRSLAAAVSNSKKPVNTPANEVRKRHREQGYEVLPLEEKQWTMLDQSLNEDKYAWKRAQEEARKAREAAAEEQRRAALKLAKQGTPTGSPMPTPANAALVAHGRLRGEQWLRRR